MILIINMWSICPGFRGTSNVASTQLGSLTSLSSCHVGGVEPIAEVSGDGDELELPQEATKFIKKKQPSKKVKKGRTSSLPFHLLPFFVSLLGAEYPPAAADPWLRFTVSHVEMHRVPAAHPQHCCPACH